MPQKMNPFVFSQALWQECEHTYSKNPQWYISLQDSHQVNVNLLLLAQYLDQHVYFLTTEQWQILSDTIAPWNNQVLVPYRQLRRIAKCHLAPDEYQKMLDVELIMERKSQQYIQQKLNTLTLPSIQHDCCSTTNVDNYLRLLSLDSKALQSPHIIT